MNADGLCFLSRRDSRKLAGGGARNERNHRITSPTNIRPGRGGGCVTIRRPSGALWGRCHWAGLYRPVGAKHRPTQMVNLLIDVTSKMSSASAISNTESSLRHQLTALQSRLKYSQNQMTALLNRMTELLKRMTQILNKRIAILNKMTDL